MLGARLLFATALTTPFLLRTFDMVRLHVLFMSLLLQLNEVLDDIRAAEAEPRVGHLPKEQPTGAIAELWTSTLQGSGLTLTDATPGVCCHGEVTCGSCMCKGVLGVVLVITWACVLCRQRSIACRASWLVTERPTSLYGITLSPRECNSGWRLSAWTPFPRAVFLFVWARVSVSMYAGFADLLSVKEESEILNAKKAAFLASKVMQAWVVEKIEDIIDKNKKVKHLKLSGEEGRGYFVILGVGAACVARLRLANSSASW